MTYKNPHLLCSAVELDARLGDRGAVILDMRPPEDFANGHIPGARSFDIFGMSLIDTRPGPMAAFLWMMEHLIALKGVSNDSHVFVYDHTTGERAARLFWFLDLFGHDNTSVLNGGFRAWTALGLEVTRDAEVPERGSFRANLRADRMATADDILVRLERADAAIVDVRSEGEYTGAVVRAARGGRIPGAIHIEWKNNLRPDGAFKSADELEAQYADLGITSDREIIPYCHGGYRSANTYLALQLVGYPRVRNYLGSWGEWGNRTDLPIEE